MASPPAPAALGRSAGVYAPVGWAAGRWTIDPAHTALSFAVRHLMSRVRGTFTDVSGQIVTSADPTGSTATAVIAVSSVSTGNQMRDDHLTIRDVTRPVHLEVEFLGTDPTGMQGETRIGFSARATISRRDFGITFGLAVDGSKIVVADTVDIVLDVQAFLGA
jgi:polyisoprenoid-binding protein YceI